MKFEVQGDRFDTFDEALLHACRDHLSDGFRLDEDTVRGFLDGMDVDSTIRRMRYDRGLPAIHERTSEGRVEIDIPRGDLVDALQSVSGDRRWLADLPEGAVARPA